MHNGRVWSAPKAAALTQRAKSAQLPFFDIRPRRPAVSWAPPEYATFSEKLSEKAVWQVMPVDIAQIIPGNPMSDTEY
jgi:hypothetical protein